MVEGKGALHLPDEEVLAVMAEDIQGIEAEIAGLRQLARGLVVWQKKAHGSKEAMQLAAAQTRAASRVAEMLKAEKQLTKDTSKDAWAEDVLAMLDRASVKMGYAPVAEAIRAAVQLKGDDLGSDPQGLSEEIASVRYMLRKMLTLAAKTKETADYVRLVEIYGSGCLRLVRMLKEAGEDQDRLERFLRAAFEQVIHEISEERERNSEAVNR